MLNSLNKDKILGQPKLPPPLLRLPQTVQAVREEGGGLDDVPGVAEGGELSPGLVEFQSRQTVVECLPMRGILKAEH